MPLRIGWLALFTVTLGGCGGGSDSSAPQPAPLPPLGLTISCAPLEPITSDTSQCTASIEGTGNSAEWEASGGTIDAGTGLFTAPQNEGTVTITATVRDAGRSASDSVEIIVRRRPLTVSGDPSLRDSRTGRTPLHVAAMANSPKLIAALVAAGADVEARDRDGLTALHAAANGPAAIAALLEAGADLNALNYDEDTPLQFAVYGSGVVTPAAVAALLDAGADPNVRDEYGTTPLHRAAWAAGTAQAHHIPGAMATLASLLESGADPNTPNVDGETPLHLAASANSAAAVTALLEAGADPDARTVYGWTPLWTWVGLGENPVIMAALLEAGADLNARDDDGDALLHLAAERDRPATLAALLEAGADLNARDNSGRTPLHAAAGTTAVGRPVAAAAAMAVLLEAGADPNARDDADNTALQLAPAGSLSLMTALLQAQAGQIVDDPNARDGFGYTALHAAARANIPILITTLVEAGADVDALDNDGHTPLLLAAGARRPRGRNSPPSTFNPAAIAALAAGGRGP